MNNQKVPKIRFKGFSGDWEQRKQMRELHLKASDMIEVLW